MKLKICGVSDLKTLEYLTQHSYPPHYIGFIVNYPKSKRFVKHDQLKKLLRINKKNSKYVAVLVKPNQYILEEIKNLPFDYYQIYDCTPTEIESIKEKYKKKIIVAITVKDQNDVARHIEYNKVAEIILFDSKGYEQSESFDHDLLNDVKTSKQIMVAGDIKTSDLTKFENKPYIIDISGHLESEKGVKDIKKIDKFLNTVHNINS